MRSSTHTGTSLFKESDSYRVEAEAQKRKLDRFVADGAEEWDIKNAASIFSHHVTIVFDSLLIRRV